PGLRRRTVGPGARAGRLPAAARRTHRVSRMAPILGIPVLNRPDLLRECLASIDLDVRLVVIDNSGTGELGDVATEMRPDALIVEPAANLGFTSSVNH